MNRNNCLFPILYIFIHIETHSRQLEEDAAAAAGHSGDAVQDLGGGAAIHPGLQVDDDDDVDDLDDDVVYAGPVTTSAASNPTRVASPGCLTPP